MYTIAKKTFETADKEDDWCGKTIGGEASEDSKGFSDVFSNGEVVELELVEVHEGLESAGVVGEGVVVAGDGLNPNRRYKAKPF